MNQSKIRHFIGNGSRINRNGASSMECILVCTLIAVSSFAAISVLGATIKDVFLVADVMAVTTNPMNTPDAVGFHAEGDSLHAEQASSTAFHMQMLAITSTLCMLIIGIFYLKLYRKRRSEVKSGVCHLAFKEHQSEALSKVHCKRSAIHSKLQREGLKMLGGTEIRPYMSTNVVTVSPTMTVVECEELLKKNGFRRVLVTEHDGRMAGVISRKDISSKSGNTVADVMTDDPKTVTPSTNLRIAISTFVQHRVSCLPIVENGLLVGLLSTSDLIVLLQCVLLELDGVSTNPQLAGELLPA